MKWVEFVKSYSSKNNKPYGQCLKDPECKKQYHEQKNNNKPDKMDHPAAPSVDSEESFILSPPLNEAIIKNNDDNKIKIEPVEKTKRKSKKQLSLNNDVSAHFF